MLRKKVLWLSHLVPYPPKGGVQQRSYNLIKEAAKYHDINLLAFNQKNIISDKNLLVEAESHFNEFCNSVDFFSIGADKSRAKKYLLLLEGLLTKNSYNMAWLRSNAYTSAVRSVIIQKKIDVIHVDTISLAIHLKGIVDVPIVLNHHNVESAMMERRSRNEKNILKKIYFYQEFLKLSKAERDICTKVDLNVTCSDLDSARLIENVGEVRCLSVPNGVDLEYFKRLDVPRKKRHLVFAGGLSWYPNLDAMRFFLEKIWPLLNSQVPNVHMTIIGKNPPEWLRAYQDRYENLLITGFVDDVRTYLSESHIYICPIRDGGGTKLKVLDALAMRIPLIADPIACEGIDVVAGQHVIFARDPEDYVLAVKNLIEDESLCRNLSENGRALIEQRYSFRSLGERLAQAFVELSR